jgi:hypothetical protein
MARERHVRKRTAASWEYCLRLRKSVSRQMRRSVPKRAKKGQREMGGISMATKKTTHVTNPAVATIFRSLRFRSPSDWTTIAVVVRDSGLSVIPPPRAVATRHALVVR